MALLKKCCLQTRLDLFDVIEIPTKSNEYATRLANSFEHAILLCGGGKDIGIMSETKAPLCHGINTAVAGPTDLDIERDLEQLHNFLDDR